MGRSSGRIIGIALAAGAVLLFLIFIIGGFFVIQAGEVGVRFDPVGGGVSSIQYAEGLHYAAPWVSVSRYNIKTQVFTMSGPAESAADQTHAGSVVTVTNEGISLTLDITIQYKNNPSKAWVMRQKIGTEGIYQGIIVLPQIRSTLRDIISNHTAVEVYGEGKAQVEQELYKSLQDKLSTNNIILESVLLRYVGLPEQLTNSIVAKQQAQQDALAMVYILQKAEQQKEQAVIQAEGIAQSNQIIANSITQGYLEWYWIQSLQDNKNVIYVPTGANGLPLFLDVQSLTPAATTPPAK